MTERRIFSVGVIMVAALLVIFGITWVFENIDAHEILVVQSPVSGELTWHTTAGIKWQGFGKITTYPKRAIYPFGIQIRFNDGAHAMMHGSIQYEMPLDTTNLTRIHVRFGNKDAVQRQLIETITNKSVYMTGPLMSSKQSYAENRNDLIRYVEDQVAHGVYKTTQKEDKQFDPMTGVARTVTVVKLVLDERGQPERQEEAVLSSFGIRPFNFAIDSLPYDAVVEDQIRQQQSLVMEVQTAVAEAKKAEQRAITAEKEGQANAAKSKWEQEVVKAKAVVEAQQRLEVAQLAAKAAEQTKKEQILLGEGEAERKKLVMQADGALEKKLAAFVDVSKAYADAIKGYQGNWVPVVMSGASDGKAAAGFGATDMINFLTIKAAKDLGLDLSVPGATRTKP